MTTSQVRATILAGADSVAEIGERCDAGTGCGGCVERLEALLAEHQPQSGEVADLPRTA